jgi:hypothetical protein
MMNTHSNVTSPRRWIHVAAAVGFVWMGMVPTTVMAQGVADGPVTFTKHVAPIFQRSCQNCHRPGSIAPMSLLTYNDARPWARAIKLKTAAREMPPWFIEKNVGIQRFKDDPSLSDQEIATIAKWVDGGAVQGNPADMPAPRTFSDDKGWNIGTPDLVVSSPLTTVEAVAADQNIQLESSPTNLTSPRYIKAVEVKEVRVGEKRIERVAGNSAGDLNYFVLHHATIASEVRRQDPEGVEGVEGRSPGRGGASMSRASGFSMTYEVGQNATIFPEDVGVLLQPGSALSWDVHLHSVGKEVAVRIDVAFKFHPSDYKPKYTQRLVQMNLASQSDLDIPAGQDNVMVDGFYVLPAPAKMLTFEPHLHSSGQRMCAEAIYPNGFREILNCSGYNHNWVKIYNYEDDVAPLLPTGTIIHLVAWYNNTSKNPRVVDPRNWKGFGSRSIDDMSTFLPRLVFLTDEDFKRHVSARTNGAFDPRFAARAGVTQFVD